MNSGLKLVATRHLAHGIMRSVNDPAFRYWAFLSYSHRDRVWADWLHRRLESWRTPRRLKGRESRDGVVPARLYPVFRDREELPSSASLGGDIADALKASRYMIVVCSPHSATSRWVNEEVRAFKALGRDNRVLTLIVDGEPNASDRPDTGLAECFCPALRYRVSADGSIDSERVEPIAADARAEGDGRSRALLKLIAGLLGVGFDELARRDRQRRQQRILVATSIALVVVAIVAGVWWSKRVAVRMEQIASLSEQGRVELTEGDPGKAAALLGEAYSLGGETSHSGGCWPRRKRGWT